MRIENSIGAPDHLDGAFFEDVLENGLREPNVTTTNISLSLGSSAGENYCSQIYRVRVNFKRAADGETEQTSVIVKSIPLVENMEFLEDMQMYFKEKLFYMDILPKLEFLLDDIKFGPRCYLTKKRPVCTIAFEDLNSLGYTMANREIGLDENHTKIALQKLGQFHAVSMVYAKKEPEMMSRFDFGMLSPKAMVPSCIVYKLFYKHLGYEIKLVSQWEGYEGIAKKLQKFYENFQNRLLACHPFREGGIKVLNHGDFWVNNLLFKYEGSTPIDVVPLDYALSVVGSPGIDLNYFLYASVQLDVLKKFDLLLQTYHDSLKDTLLKLRYDDIPTYDEIVHELKQAAAYGVFTLFGPLPVMTIDKTKSDDNSFENLLEGDGSDDKMMETFSSKRLTEHLKYSLKLLDSLGALDA